MRNSGLAFDIQMNKPTHSKIMVDYISTNNVCSINNISNPTKDCDIYGEYCITKQSSINENSSVIAVFEKNDTVDCLIRVNLHAENGGACIDIEKPVKPIDVITLKENIFLNQINTSPLCHLNVSTKIARKIKKNLQDGYQEYKRLSDKNKVKIGKIKILHKEH